MPLGQGLVTLSRLITLLEPELRILMHKSKH